MMLRQKKTSIFIGIITVFHAFYAFAAKPTSEQAVILVKDLSNQVIQVLKQNENNLQGRSKGFEEIFSKASDVKKIARFIAGSAWKNADEATRSDYVEVYRLYMASLYASRITQYNNQEVKVGRVSDLGDNGYLVNTKLLSPNDPKGMLVEWQLSVDNDQLKISDLKIENISMALTQRAEFMTYLLQNNNSLTSLTSLLKKRLM